MPLVREEMLEILFYYKRLGFSIHVVSASPSLWVDEISSQLNLDQAVSTILEDVNGVYTGVFIGSNCAGSEKVERIKRLFDKQTGDIWIGFGNLPDDSELLRICDEGFVVKKRRQFIMKRLT
jgi:phosphoserine phosphatase